MTEFKELKLRTQKMANQTTTKQSIDEPENIHLLSASSDTFTIATSVVTQVTGNLTDASFLHQTSNSYNQHDDFDLSGHSNEDLDRSRTSNSKEGFESDLNPVDSIEISSITKSVELETRPATEQRIEAAKTDLNQVSMEDNELASSQDIAAHETSSVNPKKKTKTTKKVPKLDTKSKLEKSRQSARECRARKKLRYQYLEDLVSNREKAVVKLREELSMFCEMSKQIDMNTLSVADRDFLTEQTKENSKS